MKVSFIYTRVESNILGEEEKEIIKILMFSSFYLKVANDDYSFSNRLNFRFIKLHFMYKIHKE